MKQTMSQGSFHLGRILDRAAPPESLLLLLLAIVVGASTGFCSVLLAKLIQLIQNFSFGTLSGPLGFLGQGIYLLAPMVGGLLVGPMILYAREAKGHGVPEVMQALIQRGGRIRARVAATKIIASSLCIGTGGSAGREGPIIQIGAALGSSVGQGLHLSDERIRNLVACGAAAGIAANFNAPIAGVVFAIEVLMCGMQMRAFSNVVIAAVSASVISRNLVGFSFAFKVPAYTMNSSVEILLYLLLGLAAALVGIFYIKVLYYTEGLFERWSCPEVLKPAVGGLFLGALGLAYMQLPGLTFPAGSIANGGGHATPLPHMYGSGFPFIETAIQGHAPFWIMLLLVFLKPIATAMTLGSGNSGGIFAPSLFIGAMLGGAMGHFFDGLLPDLHLNTGAFALVGMAALFAAAARSPLTAMLIVFEMSNDYFMILPLMVAGISASYFSYLLHPDSIYTVKLSQRGVRFAEGRDLDVMQGVMVREVMREDVVTIDKDASISELMALFQDTNLLGVPVLDHDGRLWGIVTLQDVHRAETMDDPLRQLRVADLAVRQPLTVFPDEPIWAAIQKMAPRDLARLPVVERHDAATLCGVVSRSDILRAYDLAMVRKQRGKLLEQEVELRRQKDNGYADFLLRRDDSCHMAPIKDLHLPETVTIVSIKRSGKTIIPRGGTVLQNGDVITVYGRTEDMEGLHDLLNSCRLPADPPPS